MSEQNLAVNKVNLDQGEARVCTLLCRWLPLFSSHGHYLDMLLFFHKSSTNKMFLISEVCSLMSSHEVLMRGLKCNTQLC